MTKGKDREPIKPSALVIAKDERQGAEWHRAIGRAVVYFGILERVMLHWAATLRNDQQILEALHMASMSAIAPRLTQALEYWRHRLPKDLMDEALAAVAEAESHTDHRNDVAHAWLGSPDDRHGVWLLVAKRDQRPIRVTAGRSIQWLVEFAKRLKSTLQRVDSAMASVHALIPK